MMLFRILGSRWFLSIFFLLVLGSWLALQCTLEQQIRKQLSNYSHVTVDPIDFSGVSFNPFTGSLVLENLKVPQRVQVGVDSEILRQRLLLDIKTLRITLSLWESWQSRQWLFDEIHLHQAQLGAVLGPEIRRVDLAYLPGIFLGLMPQKQGYKHIPYEIKKLELTKGQIHLTPSPQAGAQSVTVNKIKLTAKRLSNRALAKNQVGVKGSVDFEGTMEPRGQLLAHFEVDSFYNFIQRANGQLKIQAQNIPAPSLNLNLSDLGFGFRFTKGELMLDLDMEIDQARWVRRRDLAKLVNARVKPTGFSLNYFSRRTLDYLRQTGGNARFENWFAGTLSRFSFGPYFINLESMF